MAGFSVIASEHSVMCSYGARETEARAYFEILEKVKNNPKIMNAKPLSRPPHSPTPVPVLTVSGAAGAKANSLQSPASNRRRRARPL